MNELLVFALLFVAIVIGWVLGRRSTLPAARVQQESSQYYRGLNYLLDGRPDGAVDAFISAMEVNSETLETHIALGKLLRRQGEVDRAIRIHENLLAKPGLPRSQVHQAHLELARDYISAGLLDRAERLLLDLQQESPEQQQAALRHLLEIYQSERDWQRAVETALELLPRRPSLPGSAGTPEREPGQTVAVALSHFRCELAMEKLDAGEFQMARKLLRETLVQDSKCVRASLMLGEAEYARGHHREAVKILRNIRQQDADYIPEAIATLRLCYRELGDEAALAQWLQECLSERPSAPLMLAVVEDMERSSGVAVAGECLSRQLTARPSLRGVAQLIGLQMDMTEGKAREDLGLLQGLVNSLLAERPTYRCDHCGFSGHHLHWSCPGCKYWGSMKSIRGAAVN